MSWKHHHLPLSVKVMLQVYKGTGTKGRPLQAVWVAAEESQTDHHSTMARPQHRGIMEKRDHTCSFSPSPLAQRFLII